MQLDNITIKKYRSIQEVDIQIKDIAGKKYYEFFKVLISKMT